MTYDQKQIQIALDWSKLIYDNARKIYDNKIFRLVSDKQQI